MAENNKKKEIGIDKALAYVGGFGKYQILLNLLLISMSIPVTFQLFMMFFATVSPTWMCHRDSTTCTFNNTRRSNDDARCSMSRADWEYTKPKEYSLVTQFDLVCDKEWLVELVSSSFYIFFAVSSVFIGWISDSYGRRIVLMPCYTTIIVVGFVSSFSPNIYVVLTSRIILGITFSGTWVHMFVLISEMVEVRYRTLSGLLFWLSIPISTSIQGLFAYLSPNWKILSIISTAPFIFIVTFYKFLPESFVWLQMQGKTEEMIAILNRIGKWNNKKLPDDILIISTQRTSGGAETTTKSSPLALFGNRKLGVESAIQIYSWTVIGLVYYGLSLEANNLGGNMYVDFVLLSAADAPGIVLAMTLSELFGRKKTIVGSAFLGNVACLLIPMFSPLGHFKIARVSLGIIGKLCISITFYAMYTWSFELFPVHLRSVAMGVLQSASKLGASGAPWIAQSLLKLGPAAPFLVMGGANMVSVMIQLWLPETRKRTNNKVTSQDTKLPAVKTNNSAC